VANVPAVLSCLLTLQFGYAHLVCLLHQNGAAVDFRGKNGLTPLMIASPPGRLGVVRVLLENGAAMDL
jgi:ankyrin repeat protein